MKSFASNHIRVSKAPPFIHLLSKNFVLHNFSCNFESCNCMVIPICVKRLK